MRERFTAAVVTMAFACGVAMNAQQRAGTPAAVQSPASAGPTIVLDTQKGPIEIALFRADAPKSVDHLLALVRKGFYRGLRFHRVERLLVQFGDPLTKNMMYRDSWGTGDSGTPIGVAEISPLHHHVRGAVGLAYSDFASQADSQFYIMKAAAPSLDGKYAVVGQVTSGMEVVDRIEMADDVRNVTIKGEGRK